MFDVVLKFFIMTLLVSFWCVSKAVKNSLQMSQTNAEKRQS